MATGLFLWDHPVSSYAIKVRLALREKNIPFQLETPRGIGSGSNNAVHSDFSQGNHRLEVPVLVDGDLHIFDSTVILEYIEDKYPEHPLRPADIVERAKARMIEDVCDSQYEAINWAMGEVETFKRAEGEKAAKLKEQARHQSAQMKEWLSKQLGDKQWFGGDVFGWADICVWPMVNRSTAYGMEPEPGTSLRDWYDRSKSRSSVQSVLEEFTVALKGMGGAADAVKKGLLKREYRDHRLEWMIKSGGIDIVQEGIQKDNIRFSWPDPLK